MTTLQTTATVNEAQSKTLARKYLESAKLKSQPAGSILRTKRSI